MMFGRRAYFAASILFISSPALCAPPAQLFNKTINVTWTQSIVTKLLATGAYISATPHFERTIYISSAGRVFVRGIGTNTARAAVSNRVENGPEVTGTTTTFQGNQVVNFGNRPGDGIAIRVTVSLDPSFSSCTAVVNVGKSGPHAKVTGIDGSPRELVDVSVGVASCSVKSGNGLASS